MRLLNLRINFYLLQTLCCFFFHYVSAKFHLWLSSSDLLRRRRPALFKSGQWHLHQDKAPVHNSKLFTDYLTKMGIKTVPSPPYSPGLAPCDFWLFPKLRGCCYETTEEMKGAVTKVIDTLTLMKL